MTSDTHLRRRPASTRKPNVERTMLVGTLTACSAKAARRLGYAGKTQAVCASAILLLAVLLALTLGGCSTSEAQATAAAGQSNPLDGTVSTLLDIDDPAEKAAVIAAKEKVLSLGREPNIIATSPAVVEICDRLELPLVGVPQSSLYETPERYQGLTEVGTAMSPDMEIVGSLAPDWILSPVSLQSDLQPKYEAVGCDWAFLNLNSVQGMYRSIQEIGDIFGKQDEAKALVGEFTEFYAQYQQAHEGKSRPKVLILMGLPGSYVIATENSYVGSLVQLAGGENVYAGASEQFLTVNTEDMKDKEPDIILRAAHALPDQVQQMFSDEFTTNDIWKHFQAVQDGRVYDLPYDTFGMSATFDYPTALEQLEPMLYPQGN